MFNKKLYLLTVILFILTLLLLPGCGQEGDDNKPQDSQAQEDQSAAENQEEILTIGISQFVDHPALNLDYKGFVDQLKEEGYIDGENVKLDFANSHGDPNLAKTIADKFVADKVDAILAITTPSSQAAAQATKGSDIPVVFIAVSDAVGAGLIESTDKPTGTNVTGVYSADPVEQQMDMIEDFLPDMSRLGLIYNAGEANSVSNANRIKKYVKDKNWKVVEATVASSNEVQMASQSLVGRVDAIFVPQDNTVISALESLLKVCKDNKIPLFCGDTESVKRGAIATVGNDEYDCGRQGAEMMARILRGEDPGTIMPEEIRKRVLMINKKAAEEIGLEIPQVLLDRADEVIGSNE